jgi:gliding motility-associated lipoprotein GldD
MIKSKIQGLSRVSQRGLCAIIITLTACNSNYSPKPKGYYKIDLPQRSYELFNKLGFPYTFEYPVYANISQDTSFFEARPENPWWINIDFPRFNGRIYISYKAIGKTDFGKLLNDAYAMTYKHTAKASSINDSVFVTPSGIEGIYFKVGGNAATTNQFLVTDSVKHFLRGALYFDATPNEDSLRVVNDFLKEDMKHLINTLKWR